MANAVGLIVLAGMVSVIAFFVPATQIPGPMWILVYVVLAVTALYTWHREALMNSTVGCLLLIAASLFFGALFLAADIIIGQIHHPDESWFGGAAKVGGPFGLPLTMLVFPGLFSVGLAGLARSVILERKAA